MPQLAAAGQARAHSFIDALLSLAGESRVREHLSQARGPIEVIAEHPITRVHRRRRKGLGDQRAQRRRIDLLLTWRVAGDAKAVVVVEVKLDAPVTAGQLSAYRDEARGLAAGGPHALILLTVKLDRAEARNRQWRAVRWRRFLPEWEARLAEVEDENDALGAVRAHAWRACLSPRGGRACVIRARS